LGRPSPSEQPSRFISEVEVSRFTRSMLKVTLPAAYEDRQPEQDFS
jgi:hypothetical protein